MGEFNVLYLEHDPDREAMRQAMSSVPANVNTVLFEDKTQFMGDLDRKLKESRYDLIVTDAFFLPDGQDHLISEKEGTYLLDEIVLKVREIDQFRVRIAVLTEFSAKLFSEPHSEALKKVDYLWYKGDSSQTFVHWQISRMKEEEEEKFSSRVLFSALNDILAGQPTVALPWRDQMIEMLSQYRKYPGELNQVEVLREPLRAIAKTFKTDAQFLKLFDMFEEAESINVAAKPKAWGHLRHVLNVFWFGYYLLNCGLFDSVGAWRRHTRQEHTEDERLRSEVNFAWLLAALFHDIGLLGERTSQLVERCRELVSVYPFGDWSMAAGTGYDAKSQEFAQVCGCFSGLMGKELSSWFQTALKATGDTVDHGILSGITILKAFEGNAEVENAVSYAASAMAIHNLGKPGEANGLAEMPTVSFDDNPIAMLLLLCDQVQVWDRDTGLETVFGAFPLECATLSVLDLDREERKLAMTITYYPFRGILPGETTMQTLRTKLGRILSDNVVPVLRRLRVRASQRSRMRIDFKLDGRWDLDDWELESEA